MGETPAERIRAQSKQATRSALLESGLALLVEGGGLRTPSIESICARAGYTRGAFYVHFEDRDAFDLAMLEWVLSDVLEAMFAAVTEGAPDVATVVDRFTESLASGRWPDMRDIRAAYLGVMAAIERSSATRERHAEMMTAAIDRLEGIVAAGQEAGDVRGGVEPRKVARILMLVAVGAIMWDNVGIPVDALDIRDGILDLIAPPAR